MRLIKICTIIAIITGLLTINTGAVCALEENVTIEPEDISKLTVDPVQVATESVLGAHPLPSPSPGVVVTSYISDNRAWTKSPYSYLINLTAQKYELDPQVIYATIMTESEGDKYAFRYEPFIKDASLCMGQILISTARSLGFTGHPQEMYEPEVCIDLVGKYHRAMIDEYGALSPVQLARAYNTGSPWKRPVRGYLIRFNQWFNETS
jgi:soluble lytic murein transglycosylase-like protein